MSQGPFYLIVEDEAGERQHIELHGDVWTIGRAEDNHLRLVDRNVSRHHAQILCNQTPVILEDLKSSYGTRCQGKELAHKCALGPGDVFYIGDFRIEFHDQISDGADTTQRLLLEQQLVSEEVTTTNAGVEGNGRELISNFAAEQSQANKANLVKLAHLGRPVNHEPKQSANSPQSPPLHGLIQAGSKAVLLCVSHHFPGHLFEVRGTDIRLGRTLENEIVLNHRSVSRHHCQLTFGSGQFMVRDLDSVNGTWVNHERYEQLVLKLGDLLELGHIKLRFIPPGQSYQLNTDDLASMEHAYDTNLIWYQQSWALLSFAGFAALLLVAALWTWGERIQQGPPAGEQNQLLAGTSPGNESLEAGRLLQQGNTALHLHQWKRASSLANAVLALDPSSSQAQQLGHTAELEQEAQRNYDLAVHAMGQAAWEQAWTALRIIPASSIYSNQASAALRQVKQALIADKVQAVRLAIKAQALQEAHRQLDEIEGLESGLTSKLGLRQELTTLEEHMGQEGKSKARPKESKVEPVDKARDVASSTSEQPPEEIAATARPPITISNNTGEDVKAIYLDGAKQLKAGAIDRAVDLFGRCVAKDKNFAPCYRALGIAHTKLGNGGKAARYYRLYLKVDPNAFDADAVRQILAPYEEGGLP